MNRRRRGLSLRLRLAALRRWRTFNTVTGPFEYYATYPLWSCPQSGMLATPVIVADGKVYVSEGDAETVKKQGGSKMKKALMKNWLDQCVAQVKGERNHPSIQIWSVENEFAYVNLINLLGNGRLMDEYEHEITKTHDAVMAVSRLSKVGVAIAGNGI